MQCLEVSGALRPIYRSLGVKELSLQSNSYCPWSYSGVVQSVT